MNLFSCSACGAALRGSEDHFSKKGKCPSCGKVFVSPSKKRKDWGFRKRLNTPASESAFRHLYNHYIRVSRIYLVEKLKGKKKPLVNVFYSAVEEEKKLKKTWIENKRQAAALETFLPEEEMKRQLLRRFEYKVNIQKKKLCLRLVELLKVVES